MNGAVQAIPRDLRMIESAARLALARQAAVLGAAEVPVAITDGLAARKIDAAMAATHHLLRRDPRRVIRRALAPKALRQPPGGRDGKDQQQEFAQDGSWLAGTARPHRRLARRRREPLQPVTVLIYRRQAPSVFRRELQLAADATDMRVDRARVDFR